MPKYNVAFTEKVEWLVEIEADSKKHLMEILKEKKPHDLPFRVADECRVSRYRITLQQHLERTRI